MEINEQRLIQLFLELVKIDAASLNEKPVADYIKSKFGQWRLPISEDDTAKKINGNCGNLFARLSNSPDVGDPMILMAHLDTVSSTSLLTPVQENGLLKTDGSTILGADDRAGVAIILYIVEEIVTNKLKHRNLEIIFSVAEEIGMFGANEFDFSKLKSKYGFILDCSAAPGSYVTRTPTSYIFKIEFFGRAAHAGVAPEKGINAISMAIDLAKQIKVGRIDENSVTNIGMIHGGEATNVVPEHVTMEGEIRSFDEDTISKIITEIKDNAGEIEKKYGGKIITHFELSFQGFDLDKSLPVIRNLEKEIQALNLSPESLTYYGGSDANVVNWQNLHAVNIGIGVTNPHSKNEHIAVEDLVNSARLISRLAGLSQRGQTAKEK